MTTLCENWLVLMPFWALFALSAFYTPSCSHSPQSATNKSIEIYIAKPINIDLHNPNYFEIDIQSLSGKGCVNNVSLQHLSIRPKDIDSSYCVPEVGVVTGFPMCHPPVHGLITTKANAGVSEVKVQFKCGTCQDNYLTSGDGAYGFCPCQQSCATATVTPERKDQPLNGVTTLDLALISKHILGVQYFTSSDQFVAADANISGTITTFDVVELRKLILGIYDSLPKVDSWVFVDKNYIFPPDPLSAPYPNSITFSSLDLNSSNRADFIAIKIGDVNGTAMPKAPPMPAPVAWRIPNAQRGSVVSVPVVYQGGDPLEAVQVGLQFDPTALTLLSPSPGDIPSWNAQCFNLNKAHEGEVKAVWVLMAPEQYILPGQTLFYLHFKVKSEPPGGDGTAWLRFDDRLLGNTGWRPDGQAYTLRHSDAIDRAEATFATPGFSALCVPNPSSGAPSFQITADRARRARLHLFGSYGASLLMQEVQLVPGAQKLSLPNAADLPTGVYIWKLLSEGDKAQGFWIKQ